MQAYNRLPSSGQNSPQSPPSSPLSRSPRYRHRGSKSGRPPPKTLAQRLVWILLSVLLKRQGIFLFAPLLYIAGMLFYMGTVSFDGVPVIKRRAPPGSVYRSPQLYAKLRPEMDADNSSADAVSFPPFLIFFLYFPSFGSPFWNLNAEEFSHYDSDR